MILSLKSKLSLYTFFSRSLLFPFHFVFQKRQVRKFGGERIMAMAFCECLELCVGVWLRVSEPVALF